MSNSVNTAGASMVGQNIGAAQYDRVRQIVFAVYRVMIAVALAASLVIYFFPEQVYGIFTDDPAVIQIGYEYIPIAILAFFSCAGRSGSNALINGSGNSRVNFITAVFDGIVLRLGLSVLSAVLSFRRVEKESRVKGCIEESRVKDFIIAVYYAFWF